MSWKRLDTLAEHAQPPKTRCFRGTRAGCRAGRTSLSIQPHHAYGVITSGTSSAASGFMSVIFR